MAESSRSSFIPRQASGVVPSVVRRKKKFHVFGFLATVLMLASMVFTGGTYLYKGFSEKQLEEAKLTLASERTEFNESDIISVQEFDRRLEAAAFLIENHTYLSKIFETLELKTQDRIQFTSFSLEQRPSNDVTITIGGGTEEFKTLALQGFVLEEDALLRDLIFTNLGTSDASSDPASSETQGANDHRINFSIEGNIASSLLMYDGSVNLYEAESETTSGFFDPVEEVPDAALETASSSNEQ